MRIIKLISILLISFPSFGQTKIDCNIFKEESFDISFKMDSIKYRLVCQTKCDDEHTVPDTSRLGFVNLYQDRFFKFTLKSAVIDTQFIVKKEIIKNQYNHHSTYLKSLLVYPKVLSIDYVNKRILIGATFLFPSGLEGTDFCDFITFYVYLNGKVSLKEIEYYKEPGID